MNLTGVVLPFAYPENRLEKLNGMNYSRRTIKIRALSHQRQPGRHERRCVFGGEPTDALSERHRNEGAASPVGISPERTARFI